MKSIDDWVSYARADMVPRGCNDLVVPPIILLHIRNLSDDDWEEIGVDVHAFVVTEGERERD